MYYDFCIYETSAKAGHVFSLFLTFKKCFCFKNGLFHVYIIVFQMTVLSLISMFLIYKYHCHLHHYHLQFPLLQHHFSNIVWYHILLHHILQHLFLPEKRLPQRVWTVKNWRQRLRNMSDCFLISNFNNNTGHSKVKIGHR